MSFPDLSEATEIAIDLETCDPNMEKYGPGWPRKDGFIVGYAVAVDGWRGYYPIAHAGGGNLDKRIVERWIQKVLLLPCDKVMHNAAYDVGWLRASGFTVNGRLVDTMLAAALIDENRFSYALNSLGFDYLKETKSEQGLKDAAADFGLHPKKELWKLPAMYVGAYAEQDASLTLKLWTHFKILLRKEEVESVFNLETELLPILIGITFRGIRFDREKATLLIAQMKAREKELLDSIKEISGTPVDMWAAATIAKAFDKLQIAYPKTTTGLPSFTKSFLESCEHPIAKAIVEARELNKTHGTFLQPYLDEVWGSEVALYYPEKYAGTTDLVGVYRGKPAIIDFKQSNKPKKKEWINDYFHQLAAYALAHDIIHGTSIEYGVVLMAVQDGTTMEYSSAGREFTRYKEEWLQRVETYHAMSSGKS